MSHADGTCAGRAAAGLAVAMLAALSAGCASVAPGAVPALPTLGLEATDTLQAAADAPRPTADDLHWWRRFDDPALAQVVEQALQASPDVAAATERRAQARALLAQAQAVRGPRLSAQAQTTLDGRRRDGDRVLQPGASLNATWDADLWGGLRAGQAAASAGLARSEALLQAERLAQASLAARAYIEWREATLDAAALEQALVLQREADRIVGIRFEAGLAPRLDLERARAEVATLRAEAAAVQSRQRQALAALQTLAGQPAGVQRLNTAWAAADERTPLPALLGAQPVLLPLDLLRLRPDLQAAEQALRVAAAQEGVAAAALRPALRLDGRILLATAAGGGALELAAATLAGVLDGVLFDGGARRAGVDGAAARTREAWQLWRGAALQALQQLEAALAAAAGSAARAQALQEALTAREAAVEQAQTLYTAGLTGFLDVLEAQRSALSARRALLQAQADRAVAAVAGFEALGLVAPPGS